MINIYLKKMAVFTLFFFIWFTLGSGFAHSTNTADRSQRTENIASANGLVA